MLNFFKRPVPDTETKTAKPVARGTPPPASKPPGLAEPLPEPEVVEGNLDSDWALWEDSVAFQDSQMQSGFGALKAPEIRESSEKKPDDEQDPFGSLPRRAP
jgi:hypothetical protein